jgi:uncharacterized protein YodC (DUF2158 family)
MTRPSFGFGEIVVVHGNLVGVVVKSWGPAMSNDPATHGKYNHDVYVRALNAIEGFQETEMMRFVYDKELSGDDLGYY